MLDLRAAAAAWLRYRRQCPIISFERGIQWHSNPDVVGVTSSRYLVEIEIKESLADYRADQKKRKWKYYETGQATPPRQFYYLARPKLAQKILPILRPGVGLMEIGEVEIGGVKEIVVVKAAPTNRHVPPLDFRQIVEMVRHQSGTLCGLAAEVDNAGRNR